MAVSVRFYLPPRAGEVAAKRPMGAERASPHRQFAALTDTSPVNGGGKAVALA
jgi:hypothetical protein